LTKKEKDDIIKIPKEVTTMRKHYCGINFGYILRGGLILELLTLLIKGAFILAPLALPYVFYLWLIGVV